MANHSFTTPSTRANGKVTPYFAGASDYQIIEDEPGICKYLLKTGTIEQPVQVTIRSNAIKSVGGLKVVNPAMNKGGAVQYSIKLETIGRRTTPVVANATEDEGIALWLTVKHDATDKWDAADLAQMFNTLLGLLVKSETSSSASGTEYAPTDFRFVDLAKGVVKM